MVIENFNVPVSVETIILLLLIGAAIKHLDAFNKVSNTYIPIVLFAFSVLITVLQSWPITLTNAISVITTALASSVIAVGIHSSGKNIFDNGQFINIFLKQFGNYNSSIQDVTIENVDEKVEEEKDDVSSNDEEPVDTEEPQETE